MWFDSGPLTSSPCGFSEHLFMHPVPVCHTPHRSRAPEVAEHVLTLQSVSLRSGLLRDSKIHWPEQIHLSRENLVLLWCQSWGGRENSRVALSPSPARSREPGSHTRCGLSASSSCWSAVWLTACQLPCSECPWYAWVDPAEFLVSYLSFPFQKGSFFPFNLTSKIPAITRGWGSSFLLAKPLPEACPRGWQLNAVLCTRTGEWCEVCALDCSYVPTSSTDEKPLDRLGLGFWPRFPCANRWGSLEHLAGKWQHLGQEGFQRLSLKDMTTAR